MRKIALVLTILWLWFPHSATAQETGPLMMGVQLGYTLGGMLAGVAVGGIVWLTDPGGPTPLSTTARDGAVLGTAIGAIAGFFLLANSAIDPNAPYRPTNNFEDLLGATSPSLSVSPLAPSLKGPPLQGISLTLLHFKF